MISKFNFYLLLSIIYAFIYLEKANFVNKKYKSLFIEYLNKNYKI